MAKDDSTKITDEENLSESQEEKIILPRRRKIVKNVQLPIVFGIFLAALITIVTWQLFFNQTINGKWYYISNGEYTETYDSPTESSDEPEEATHKYTQRVVYEFNEGGECIVTLGTMSVVGQYDLYSTTDSRMFTAAVIYQYTPILYGSYNYRVEGNVFTGKKLVISAVDSDEEITLEEGEGESPLEPYEDFKGDNRLVGKWRDEELGIEYEFTSDGYFTRSNDDGLVIEHTYSIIEDGVIMTTYFGDSKQNYSYVYEFDDDNNLSINGSLLTKLD